MRIGSNIIVAVALGLAAMSTQPMPPAMAQTIVRPPSEAAPPPRRRIPRITVVPLSRYQRECSFWLAVEHRPSGDVITPQQHCWWALR